MKNLKIEYFAIIIFALLLTSCGKKDVVFEPLKITDASTALGSGELNSRAVDFVENVEKYFQKASYLKIYEEG